MKKLITTLTISTFLLGAGLFLIPQQANAQLDAAANIFNSVVNTLSGITETTEGFGDTVLEPLVKEIANSVLDKIVDETVTWANGGYNGDPGFINNWDEFLRGTQHEVISGAFSSALINNQNATSNQNLELAFASCVSEANDFAQDIDPEFGDEYDQALESELALCDQILNGDPAGDAQSNWNIWQSGEIQTARLVAETIALTGSQQLNQNALESLINGEGETLSVLLGSQAAKEDFKTDITVGGWTGYLALADPHNTDRGLTELVENTLLNQVSEETNSLIQDLQTPQKFLNKVDCTEYNDDGSCAREVTVTPGSLVNNQLSRSLEKEINQLEDPDGWSAILYKSLGNLAGGLLENGVNNGISAATQSFFDAGALNDLIQETGITTEYSSQYDVLGISGGGITPTSATASAGSQSGIPLVNIDGTVREPDIDLENELQFNLDLLEEERGYYNQMSQLMLNTIDVIHEFDKCVPGPDFNWEERLNDVVTLNGNGYEDSDREALKRIAVSEMRRMLQDSQSTIPGGVEMRNQIDVLFGGVEQNLTRVEFRLDSIRTGLANLSLIKASISGQFNEQKINHNENLVIFAEDWDELNVSQQTAGLSYVTENIPDIFVPSEYINEEDGSYAIDEIITTDNDLAREIVMSAAWNIWRNEIDLETHLSMSDRFVSMEEQTFLSNSRSVIQAEAQRDQIASSILFSYDVALDCLLFKAYATGTDYSELLAIMTNASLDKTDRIEAVAEIVDSRQAPVIRIAGSVYIQNYNVDAARTDDELRQFLEQEAFLQESPTDTSLLQTPVITNVSAINNSILGFATEEEKIEYFEAAYPQDEFIYFSPGPENKTTIGEIYENDRTAYSGRRGGKPGYRTTVFCRLPGKFDSLGSSDGSDDVSTCMTDWSTTEKIDYRIALSN